MTVRTTLQAAALSAAIALVSAPAWAAETYYFDQGHTEVHFKWSHAGVSMQHGEFTKLDGKLSLDPNNVENSVVDVTIDANSLDSGFQALDEHLKSPDFFDVATYPTITFKSTSVKQTGDDTADIVGDLTIHGVTKPVTLQTKLTHRGAHPVAQFIEYYKGEWVAFHATTEIDHTEFGVGSFNTGTISIEINTEMKDREN